MEVDPFLKGLKDWQTRATALSTKVFPKPMVYRAYQFIGLGSIHITPYWTTTGKGFMTEFIFHRFGSIPKKSPFVDKSFVRALDESGRQIGHEFIDMQKRFPIKEGKPIWEKKPDYGLKPSQIRFEKTEIDVGDVLRTPKTLRKSVLGRRLLYGKGWLPDYETYKGPSLFGEVGTKLILRPRYDVSKIYPSPIKPIYYLFFGVKPVEPAIKSFRGFKGRTYSLKDLTKKWEMEKSDVDKDVIHLGGRGRQQVLLKPPKVKTEKITRVKPKGEVKEPPVRDVAREKVSTDWLRRLGRFEVDEYVPIRFVGFPVRPESKPKTMPISIRLPELKIVPISISDQESIVEEIPITIPKTDLIGVSIVDEIPITKKIRIQASASIPETPPFQIPISDKFPIVKQTVSPITISPLVYPPPELTYKFPKPPWKPPSFEDKKKKVKPIDVVFLGKGYRFRSWKVPTMEEFLKGSMW